MKIYNSTNKNISHIIRLNFKKYQYNLHIKIKGIVVQEIELQNQETAFEEKCNRQRNPDKVKALLGQSIEDETRFDRNV